MTRMSNAAELILLGLEMYIFFSDRDEKLNWIQKVGAILVVIGWILNIIVISKGL